MAPQAKPKTQAPVPVPARSRAWRSWLLALLLFGAMGLGAAWGWERLTDPALLPLRVVHIEGELHYLPLPVLERAVAPEVSGSFFDVDLERVRRAAAALAWIERAEARRVWPDRLQLRVDEQLPLALWGSVSLVNRRGQVFTPEDGGRPAGLAQLDGPGGSEIRVSAEYLALRPRLRKLGLKVSRLRLDARGAWTLELEQGPVVHFGRHDLAARIGRFVRLYPRLMASGTGRMEVVDMRYANGLAVRWRPAEVAAGGRGRLGAVDGRSA
jgi:cell division protein FtsQ